MNPGASWLTFRFCTFQLYAGEWSKVARVWQCLELSQAASAPKEAKDSKELRDGKTDHMEFLIRFVRNSRKQGNPQLALRVLQQVPTEPALTALASSTVASISPVSSSGSLAEGKLAVVAGSMASAYAALALFERSILCWDLGKKVQGFAGLWKLHAAIAAALVCFACPILLHSVVV